MRHTWRNPQNIAEPISQTFVATSDLLESQAKKARTLTVTEKEHAARVNTPPPNPEINEERQDDPIRFRAPPSQTVLHILPPPGVGLAIVVTRWCAPVGPGASSRYARHTSELGRVGLNFDLPGGNSG